MHAEPSIPVCAGRAGVWHRPPRQRLAIVSGLPAQLARWPARPRRGWPRRRAYVVRASRRVPSHSHSRSAAIGEPPRHCTISEPSVSNRGEGQRGKKWRGPPCPNPTMPLRMNTGQRLPLYPRRPRPDRPACRQHRRRQSRCRAQFAAKTARPAGRCGGQRPLTVRRNTAARKAASHRGTLHPTRRVPCQGGPAGAVKHGGRERRFHPAPRLVYVSDTLCPR